jgi:hypothetical protein
MGEPVLPDELEGAPVPEAASPLPDPESPANAGDEKEISAPIVERSEPPVPVAPPDAPAEVMAVAESSAASVEPGSSIEIPSSAGNRPD